MTPVEVLARLHEAEERAERANSRVIAWTAACGPGVWREGHPLDREKLRARQDARRAVIAERRALRELLRTSEGGRA